MTRIDDRKPEAKSRAHWLVSVSRPLRWPMIGLAAGIIFVFAQAADPSSAFAGPSRVRVVVHGGAGEVAGSMAVLDTGNGLWMIDCGAEAPERESRQDSSEAARRATLPVAGRSISAVFLTHAHTDHVGRLPWLLQDGFSGPIFATKATLELLPVMVGMQIRYDAGRQRNWSWSSLSQQRAKRDQKPFTVHWCPACRYQQAIAPKNRRLATLSLAELSRRIQNEEPDAEIRLCQQCVEDETSSIVALCRALEFDKPMDVASGIKVALHYAGHIPGSASILFEVSLEKGRRRILFSGDVGNDLSPLFPGPRPAPDADAVFIETTYGPTFRDPSIQHERAWFRRSVGKAVERGAVAWIPAFALDRTQKILYELHLAQQESALPPGVPIYCSSPTALEITAIYEQNRQQGWFRESVARDPAAWAPTGLRKSPGLPKSFDRPAVLLTTSGMLDFGASEALLEQLVPNANAAIFLVGYQEPESPGGRLMKAVGLLREGTRDQASLKSAARFALDDSLPKAPRDAVIEWKGKKSRFAPPFNRFAASRRTPTQKIWTHGFRASAATQPSS